MEEDFCLLGMVSDEPDYRLCWMMNQHLEMEFEKMEDLQLNHKKLNEQQIFSMFAYEDEEAMITYRVIRNRAEVGYFLDELKNLDYLVHIQGEIITDRIQHFIQAVGTLDQVRLCVPVDLQRIRNKERLMLW
jgi:hypothetical protein